MKQTIIIILCVAILCIGCLVFSSCAKKPSKTNVDSKLLTEFHYSCGGGMDGGYYLLSLNNNEGKYTLSLDTCEYVGAEENTKSLEVDGDVIAKVDSIARKCDMYSWGELPESDEFALDAPSTSISFYFEDGSTISFGDRTQLPDNAWDNIREITDYLEDLLKSDQ